jgi:hypothetical protein
LGFSKKLENLRHSVALLACYWNFCWLHHTTKQTPAQATGLTDHAWTVEELLAAISSARIPPQSNRALPKIGHFPFRLIRSSLAFGLFRQCSLPPETAATAIGKVMRKSL